LAAGDSISLVLPAGFMVPTAIDRAQVTILCSMMLIAHTLPLELSISKKAGAAVLPIAVLRVGGAVLYAVLLDRLCRWLDLWQGRPGCCSRPARSNATSAAGPLIRSSTSA